MSDIARRIAAELTDEQRAEELRGLVDDGIAALVGDSNDAEHGALYGLVQFLAPEALSTAEAIQSIAELGDPE